MKKVDLSSLKLEPGKVYVFNIRHDDDCRYWQNDNFDECNCDPDFEAVEVTEENMAQISEQHEKDEVRARAIRDIARRRN